MSECAAKVLKSIQAFFDHVNARGVTKPDCAIIAESGAWNNCDTRLAQQTIGEILRSQSELARISNSSRMSASGC